MNIRERFRRALFENRPQFMGEALITNQNLVFPGRDEFIRFLTETDNQKRTESAKKILSRLAYESRIYLPYSLIISILTVEENNFSNSSESHIPQDHFVHLVNLYLLGIYLFTSHKKLHRSLSAHFRTKRATEHCGQLPQMPNRRSKISSSLGKHFVLRQI